MPKHTSSEDSFDPREWSQEALLRLRDKHLLEGIEQQRRRWEYAWSRPHSTKAMNEMGAEGWELVATSDGIFFYKRPLLQAADYISEVFLPARDKTD